MPFLLPSLPALTAAAHDARPANAWPLAWVWPGFRWRLGLVLALLAGLLLTVAPFFHFIQARPGRQLADPLLALLPTHDVSAVTFALIYGSIAGTLAYLLPRPYLLLRALWAYYLLQLLRMATLWLLPLEPPAGLVVLHDPLIDRLFEATAQPIDHDLFFSGHTATAALLALAVRGPWRRRALGLLTGTIGLLVLVQRVHYSYDVLAAPLFAWLAYGLAGRICNAPSTGAATE